MVFIRGNMADVGTTPTASPWWDSPDLWVCNADDNGTVYQNPIAGQTVHLPVMVGSSVVRQPRPMEKVVLVEGEPDLETWIEVRDTPWLELLERQRAAELHAPGRALAFAGCSIWCIRTRGAERSPSPDQGEPTSALAARRSSSSPRFRYPFPIESEIRSGRCG